MAVRFKRDLNFRLTFRVSQYASQDYDQAKVKKAASLFDMGLSHPMVFQDDNGKSTCALIPGITFIAFA